MLVVIQTENRNAAGNETRPPEILRYGWKTRAPDEASIS